MTTSPYDNLPVSKSCAEDQLEYIDVDLEDAADTDAEPVPVRMKPPRSADTAANIKSQPKNPVKTSPFDHPPKYSHMAINTLHSIYEYILPFEESLLVPDTMPDIESILFAEGRAGLSSPEKTSYQKNDFISGTITVFTVYRPAGDSACPAESVRSSVPFRTDKCWSDTDCDQFRSEISIKSISAEMINERKFIVRGELRMIITGTSREKLKALETAGDDDLMMKRCTVQAADLDFETVETTEISQEITLREGQPSPVRILEESIRITENHRQITSGKLVINATVHSSVLYLGEEDSTPVPGSISSKTDFTQFILIKDDTDADMIRTSYDTGDLRMTIASQDQLILQGNITVQIQGYLNRELPAVTDAYHKTKDICFDTAGQPLTALKSAVSGEISAREVLADDDRPKPETLLCGHGVISEIKSRTEKGRIAIEGTIPIKLLALDEDGRAFAIETVIPLRGTLELAAAEEGMTACTFAYIKDFWFDKINSRQLEINVSITINSWLCSSENFSTLENLCFAEGTAPARRVPMAVYVVEPEDTLWDIAKRYRCDTDTLAQLNQIDPEKPLPAGMKIFVMK